MNDTETCYWCKETYPIKALLLTYDELYDSYYCTNRIPCVERHRERRKTIMDKSIACELVEIRHENFAGLNCIAHIGESVITKPDGIFGLPRWYCETSGKILAYTALETHSE